LQGAEVEGIEAGIEVDVEVEVGKVSKK
jgi:hypothetical protein